MAEREEKSGPEPCVVASVTMITTATPDCNCRRDCYRSALTSHHKLEPDLVSLIGPILHSECLSINQSNGASQRWERSEQMIQKQAEIIKK